MILGKNIQQKFSAVQSCKFLDWGPFEPAQGCLGICVTVCMSVNKFDEKQESH